MELLTITGVVYAIVTGDVKFAVVMAAVLGLALVSLVVFRSQVELVNPFRKKEKNHEEASKERRKGS